MEIITVQEQEGKVLNNYLYNRLVRKNQNVLIAVTGPTGSGKSYASLKIGEQWYNYHFKEEFPIRNCCFSVEEVIKLLNSGELRRGEVIIMEEGGVNLGNLDFQSKISKLFTYVLQSFRSMNIGLIINLPVLTMLNKSARLLIHANFITMGIDIKEKVTEIKPLFHQLNQQSGKVYPKFLRVVIYGEITAVERFYFSLPCKELIQEYEIKKKRFVSGFINDFIVEIEVFNRDKAKKNNLERKPLTDRQEEVMKCFANIKESNKYECASKILRISMGAIHVNKRLAMKKGYTLEEFRVNVEET